MTRSRPSFYGNPAHPEAAIEFCRTTGQAMALSVSQTGRDSQFDPTDSRSSGVSPTSECEGKGGNQPRRRIAVAVSQLYPVTIKSEFP